MENFQTRIARCNTIYEVEVPQPLRAYQAELTPNETRRQHSFRCQREHGLSPQ